MRDIPDIPLCRAVLVCGSPPRREMPWCVAAPPRGSFARMSDLPGAVSACQGCTAICFTLAKVFRT